MAEHQRQFEGEDPTRGAPYCGDCGYDLTGCHDSSRCPECGRPLVDVLMRPTLTMKGGRRWRSKARIGRWPVIDIAFGAHGNERLGKPRGFIAIGDQARGIFAFGGMAQGVVAFGGMAMGGITFGGMSIGIIEAFGGMAIGGMAMGGFAIGGLAQGGGALGIVAQGGMAIGQYVRGGGTYGPHQNDQAAAQVFSDFSWFFGTGGSSMMGFVAPLLIFLGASAAIGLIALWKMTRDSESGHPGNHH